MGRVTSFRSIQQYDVISHALRPNAPASNPFPFDPVHKMTICNIEGCERKSHARGMCAGHDHRFRKYGDPLKGRTAIGEAIKFFEDGLLYEGDMCLIWPYSKNTVGYGQVKYGDRMEYVHRLACIEANGPPPTPSHEAAHSCGKGSSGCFNKRHLSWKTRLENQADRVGHGTHIFGERHGRAKISEEAARAILAMKGAKSQRAIAAEFGVSQSHVSEIHKGKKWGWLASAA